MDIHDHSPTAGGRAFLWGGIGLGLLLIVLLLTHGFGLFAGSGNAAAEAPALVRKGAQVFIPEKSPLRERLTLLAAPAEARSTAITAPGIVESDPARTITVTFVDGAIPEMVQCEARLRYHAPAIAALYESGRLTLDEPFLGAAPGQAAVLYSGSRVLGGGIIASARA